ncbi:DUF4867 family protein [Ruminococcus gauvreauii]|uniref:DUF4867 family protein n=1 Tax=Ruminococcus gauvreauii TaxID=438033 RepID=A0ABY5VF88_9FIRM|nr:DUF4867 family protein [Ruminococcus gauvreauii]UWP58688.1 DUF4867 family protein [Ruminococcus gauvreauii]
MRIQEITAPSFRKYGKILRSYDVSGLLEEMKHTPLPDNDVIYVPSDQDMEQLPAAEEFKNRAYGGLPIQIGYCNGNNRSLNAVEYHRDSEINVAVTDLILLLGMQQDIADDLTYETSKMEAFLLPAGTAAELYATTLHYAPISVSGENFRCVVVLPRGTNTDIDFPLQAEGEDRLMAAKNKWLIAHPDAGIKGAFCGLKGDNITL